MMKLDLYESRLFGRICYGFGRDEDGYVYIKDDETSGDDSQENLLKGIYAGLATP